MEPTMQPAQRVLKGAGMPSGRVLLGVAPSSAQAVAHAEPGRWVSHAELEALLGEARRAGEAAAAERIQAQALEQSRQRAAQELRTQLEQLRKEQAEKLRGLALALAEQMAALREQLSDEVSEWTYAAACRLQGELVGERVADSVRQVLREAQLDAPLTILLHADDAAAMAEPARSWPEGVRFEADERVSLGGCMLQTELQTLDARFETQLQLLRKQLDLARQQRRNPS